MKTNSIYKKEKDLLKSVEKIPFSEWRKSEQEGNFMYAYLSDYKGVRTKITYNDFLKEYYIVIGGEVKKSSFFINGIQGEYQEGGCSLDKGHQEQLKKIYDFANQETAKQLEKETINKLINLKNQLNG